MAKKKYKPPVLSRINRDKSNRMAIAVVIGVSAILLIWILAMLLGDRKGPPQAMAENALEYLDKREGIAAVNIDMAQNRVEIRYDYSKEGDFVLITKYAALKLSNSLPDNPIDFTLTPELPGSVPVYRCQVQDGALLSEWLGTLPVYTPPADSPEKDKK